MTTANNITDILQPYLKKIESAYNRVHYSDDVDCQKNCYAIGEGGLIISVKKVDASLTIQVIEEMSLKNIEDYLTDRGLPGTWKGFAYKATEEVQEILDWKPLRIVSMRRQLSKKLWLPNLLAIRNIIRYLSKPCKE